MTRTQQDDVADWFESVSTALIDDFAGDIAIWLRVHTDSRDWSSQTESVRGLAAHLVRVVESNTTTEDDHECVWCPHARDGRPL